MIHITINGIMTTYVYENALCRVSTDFDARLCKIRRVVLPVDDDDDIVYKLFVQESMQILKDQQDEIEKKMISLQNNGRIMLKYVQNTQSFKDQLNLFEEKITTLQNNIQVKTTHRTE